MKVSVKNCAIYCPLIYYSSALTEFWRGDPDQLAAFCFSTPNCIASFLIYWLRSRKSICAKAVFPHSLAPARGIPAARIGRRNYYASSDLISSMVYSREAKSPPLRFRSSRLMTIPAYISSSP